MNRRFSLRVLVVTLGSAAAICLLPIVFAAL